MLDVQYIPMSVVLLASLVAAVTDLRRLRIYNALTLPLIVSGMVYQGWVGGQLGIAHSVVAVAVSGGILLIPYILGGIGAGDVKLMAGVGAWLGMPLTVYVFLASSLAAGVYAAVLLLRYGGLRQIIRNLQIMYYKAKVLGSHIGPEENIETVLANQDRYHRVIPFGAMVAVGVLLVVLWMRA